MVVDQRVFVLFGSTNKTAQKIPHMLTNFVPKMLTQIPQIIRPRIHWRPAVTLHTYTIYHILYYIILCYSILYYSILYYIMIMIFIQYIYICYKVYIHIIYIIIIKHICTYNHIYIWYVFHAHEPPQLVVSNRNIMVDTL